jgi:DNA-binding Xre family transcriptional regulator
MPNVRERLLEALSRRRIRLAQAARICGTSSDTFERLSAGLTRKVNADWLQAICATLAPTDRLAFLREVVLTPDAKSGERFAGVEPGWIADDGEFLHAPDGLIEEARRRLGTPGENYGDVRAFVARGFGWVGIEPVGHEGMRVTLDRMAVTAAAAAALEDAILASRARFALVGLGAPDAPLQKFETRDLATIVARMVRARTPIPKGWVDMPMPFGALKPELRSVLDSGAAGNMAHRFVDMINAGGTSLFKVVDGEAVCLHIGSRFNVPTRRWIGARVLDRTQLVPYAAMIDRHAREAAESAQPEARVLRVDFGTHWTAYQKLILPFRLDDATFVATTSVVLEESSSRTPN